MVQRLYDIGMHEGVVTVLTENAYRALKAKLAHLSRNGSCNGFNPELERHIAKGTMTFVEEGRSTEGHTGNHVALRMIALIHDVVIDETVSLPGCPIDAHKGDHQTCVSNPDLLTFLLGPMISPVVAPSLVGAAG